MILRLPSIESIDYPALEFMYSRKESRLGFWGPGVQSVEMGSPCAIWILMFIRDDESKGTRRQEQRIGPEPVSSRRSTVEN
jgi:hypothetical protein